MKKERKFIVYIEGKDGKRYKAILTNCKITKKNFMARIGGDVKETIECDEINIRKLKDNDKN